MNWRQLFSRSKSPHYAILDHYDGSKPQEGDDLVVRQLRAAGADLSQARDALHYLYLPSEAVASQAARELYEEGYAVERRPSADAHNNPPNPWLVLAKIETIVNEAQVTRARALFTALAVRHGGEYDGWEAATKP